MPWGKRVPLFVILKPPLLIVSPHFPPLRGGLADHTERLASELSARCEVSVLTSTGAGARQKFSVHARVDDWQNATELLAAVQNISPDGAVLWQYVPHMYGRGGVNLALPRVMAILSQQRRRQFVIAHEIAAPFAFWPQRFWYALAHRWQWRHILRHAGAIGISTEAWLDEWSRRAPQFRDKFCLLPSPSSIPVVPVAGDHAAQWRHAQGLPANARILAYFGTISGAKQFDWVWSAWQQAQTSDVAVALVVIGDVPTPEVPMELKTLFKPFGYLLPPEVSSALQAVDVLALPFIDGVSERRTSFMAGLSHGCAIVTTLGSNTGAALRRAPCFEAESAGEPARFAARVVKLLQDGSRRRELRRFGRAAYDADFDWPKVVRTLTGKWLEDA